MLLGFTKLLTHGSPCAITFIVGDFKFLLSVDGSSREFFLRRQFPLEVDGVTKLLGKGDLLVDVGANLGKIAITAAKRVGENGTVIAVEPSRLAFINLCRNIELNELSNVWPINAAVSWVGELERLTKESHTEISQISIGSGVSVITYPLDVLLLPILKSA